MTTAAAELNYTHRADYIERYSKDAWKQAVTLAARHRARASTKYGQTEHFTAWEWLDLCAQTDFCCSSCGANAPLEAHHCTALFTLGSNTINNIAPLCSACHHDIPIPHRTGITDISTIWLAQQEDIHLKRPPINTLIKYEHWGYAPNNRRLGVIVKTETPVLAAGPLWGRQPQEWDLTYACVEPIPERLLINYGVYPPAPAAPEHLLENYEGYPPAQPLHIPPLAWVRWADDKEASCVELRHLSVVDVEATKKEALSWLQAQEELMAPWAIGDCVCPHQHKKQIKHGIIEQVVPHKALALTGFIGENDAPALPAQWLPLSSAMAKIRWTYNDGTTKVTRIGCQNLRRTDYVPNT